VTEWDLLSGGPEDIRRLIDKEKRQDKAAIMRRGRYTAPRTRTEQDLTQIFAELLSIEPVGVEDDFFALGGQSILATQLISRIRTKFRVEASLDWIVEAPTVERLTLRVDAALKEGRLAALEDVELPQAVASPETANEPFELTEIQQAYWVGRGKAFELGNISTHVYLEFEKASLDVGRLERAWQRVVARHGMLRVVIDRDGRQRVQSEAPPYRIDVADLREVGEDETTRGLEAIRAAMSHQVFDTGRGPMFDIRAALLAGGTVRTYFSIDCLVVDAGSLSVLFGEWEQLYAEPDTSNSSVRRISASPLMPIPPTPTK
jgi:hypothetical protein